MNENDDFDDEMKGDGTMELYQRLWNKQESPRSLDQKVLENYRKTFPSKQSKTTFSIGGSGNFDGHHNLLEL